jgi:hypothetical protein
MRELLSSLASVQVIHASDYAGSVISMLALPLTSNHLSSTLPLYLPNLISLRANERIPYLRDSGPYDPPEFKMHEVLTAFLRDRHDAGQAVRTLLLEDG